MVSGSNPLVPTNNSSIRINRLAFYASTGFSSGDDQWGGFVSLERVVLSAVAVYVGIGIIIHVGLPKVIPSKITHESLRTGLLIATFGVLLHVGFWVS